MTTTIKVSAELRDRLKSQASDAGMSLGRYLESLAQLAERKRRFASLTAAIAEMSPEHRASYQRETEAWDAFDIRVIGSDAARQ